jgi:hypothetical protein
MADFTAAATTRERAVTGATHDNKARPGGDGKHTASPLDAATFTWMDSDKSRKFSCSGLLPWLSDLDNFKGNAMGHWLREQSGVPSHMWYRPSGVKGRQNPTKDRVHEYSVLLSRQFRAFQNEDPKQAQQKALPFSVLDELAKPQVTELDKTIIQITIGAAFFTCCSCKYLRVPRKEVKCTNSCAYGT